MFCHKCGNKLVEGSAFCQNCGSKANAGAPAQQTMNVPVQPAAPGPGEQTPWQAPAVPAPPVTQAPVTPAPAPAPAPAYTQLPAEAVKEKGKKKTLVISLVVCAAIIAVAAVFVFLIMPNLGDRTDYIAMVSMYQPFESRGYTAEYDMVFGKFINSIDYEERREGDSVFIDVSGTLRGSGERITISLGVSSGTRVTPRSVRVGSERITSRNDAEDFLLFMFEAYDEGLDQLPLGDRFFGSASSHPMPAQGGGSVAPPQSPAATPGPAATPAPAPAPATQQPQATATPPPSAPADAPAAASPAPLLPAQPAPAPTPAPPSETYPAPGALSNTEILAEVIMHSDVVCWLVMYWENGEITVFEREYYSGDWIMQSRDGSVRKVDPTFWLDGDSFMISFPTTTRLYNLKNDSTGRFGTEALTWLFDY